MEHVVRTIRLYGSLGAKFGREHRYVVSSPRDALRALGVMIPGFWQELCRSGECGVRYAVFAGVRNLDHKQLDVPTGDEAIRIAPVLAGSKAGGVFQTIAGGALAAAGAASMFILPGNAFGVNLMLMGGSLALGGIAQLLSPQTPTPPRLNQHGMPGIQNVAAQGGPVPLLYGRMRVGSTVISECLRAEDLPLRKVEQSSEADDVQHDSIENRNNDNRYLNSKVIYTAVDLVSEGEIEGLNRDTDSEPGGPTHRSIYLDDVPLQNFDGTENFEIDNFFYRYGKRDQLPFDSKVIDAATNEVHVGAELRRRLVDEENGRKRTVALPWVLELDEPDVDELALTLSFSDQRWDDKGRITNAQVDIEVTTSCPSESSVKAETNTYMINGICESYHKTYVFPVPPGKPFRLQVKRTDQIEQGDNAKKKHGKVHIESYTKRRTGCFSYPASALMAVQITSEKFDRIPVRSYDLKGLIVGVPSNYDPDARSYIGQWDGTFKRRWTDNPAWIFRDLLLNRRYGAGAWVQEAMVDRYGLYAIAKYCDELVPNGDGGTEPRFTCNCHITSRSHAFALLQQLASVFRGIVFWSAGSVLSSADMPSDPVYVYNAANVVDGIFKYTGSSLNSRYTSATVTWCNPHNGYKQAVETVEDAEGIALYGYNAAEITAFGCTSRSQAQRAGHWLLQTSRLETETVTFSVGLDGALALPGQVIEIADPLRSASCSGGRIKEIDAAGRIILDREVQAEHGDRLVVILPDARARSVEIDAVSGAAVTVRSPFAQVPVSGAAWTLRSAGSSLQSFRVVSVSEVGEGTAFSITATRHVPDKYEAVDNAATSNIIYDKYEPIDSPANLAIRAVMGSDAKMAAEVFWKFVPGAKQYNVTLVGPNADTRHATAVGAFTLKQIFNDVAPGSYTAQVCAQGWDGRLSIPVQAAAHLPGLMFVQTFGSLSAAGRVVFQVILGQVANVPQYIVELRFGQTSDFSEAKESLWSMPNNTVLSKERSKGYAWARVHYGRSAADRGALSVSEWYPSKTGPGIGF